MEALVVGAELELFPLPNRVDPDMLDPTPPNRPRPVVEVAPAVEAGVVEALPNMFDAGLFAPPPNRPPPVDEGAGVVDSALPNNEGPDGVVVVAPPPPKREGVAGFGVMLVFPARLPNKPPPDD